MTCLDWGRPSPHPLDSPVIMDDVDSPDMAFLADSVLADRIQAAIQKYFAAVGK